MLEFGPDLSPLSFFVIDKIKIDGKIPQPLFSISPQKSPIISDSSMKDEFAQNFLHNNEKIYSRFFGTTLIRSAVTLMKFDLRSASAATPRCQPRYTVLENFIVDIQFQDESYC